MDWFKSLQSPDVGPWVFVLFLILVVVIINIKNSVKKKEKKSKSTEDEPQSETTSKTTETKEPRNWNFKWFGWFRPDFWNWDIFLVRVIVPGIIIIGGLLWYYNKLYITPGGWVWIIILSLALIIFATRSNWFRWFTIWGGSAILVGLMIYGLTTLNLMGTPCPTEAQVANLWLDYDVSVPRWTAVSVVVPDNCMLDISAEGEYWWDTLDTRGPCDPNGMRDTANGLWMPTKRILRPETFLQGLLNNAFAGLIGKVGEDGEPFFIGKHCIKIIEDGGMLYLGINIRWGRTGGMAGFNKPDPWKQNWANAKGIVEVDVTIRPPSGGYDEQI